MADAGIVDQDIEPTLGSRDLLYRGLNLRLFSHIKLLCARTPSRGPNFADNLLHCIQPDIGKNDMRALLRKEPCNLLSDARSSPCHKGDFLI